MVGNDSDDESEVTNDKLALALIGKLCTDKSFSVESFKKTINKIWRTRDGVFVRAIEEYLFIFQFFNPNDKHSVLDGRPWSFTNSLLLLEVIKGDMQPADVDLKLSPF